MSLIVVIVVGFAATPVIAQSGFLKTRFDSLDANKDGKISLSEAPRPGMVLLNDVDKDRALSPSEFETLMNRIVDGTAASKGNEEPWKAAKFAGEIPADASITKASVLAAAKYSAENRGISFLVMYDGELIYADYPNGGAIERAHELASGTKSFTGVTAIAAIEDGIIESLDEKVCDTITAWKTDPMKSQITVRHLLTLTCGLTPESSDGRQVPRFASAIENKALAKPGDTFAYGPVPFQCFGEFLRLKLIARGLDESPLDYMNRRIFRPIGLEYGAWRMDEDGNPNLPSGAQLTATDWAKFGELIRLGGTWEGNEIVPLENLDQCLAGSDANPAYGFTFWLNQPVAQQFRRTNRQLRFATDDMTGSDVIPSDLIFAAGAGKQRLLISRDAKLVVVRQASGIVDSLNGKRDTFSDRKFMTRLMK